MTSEIEEAPVAVYDVWGKRLFGGFKTKSDAALWLLNNVPWRLLDDDTLLGGRREVRRVPTEYEADLYIRHKPSMTKERCDPREYGVYFDLHPLETESENS